MNIQDKELLLKDLCARLPYGVIVRIGDDDAKAPLTEIVDVIGKDYKSEDAVNGWSIDRICIKPYLRPMSSMIKEEYLEISWDGCTHDVEYSGNYPYLKFKFKRIKSFTLSVIDWLNAHHFDYRGLIEKGLALEAPEYMYNN